MSIQEIMQNGGATINYKGVAVAMVSGYQVSKKDLGRVAVADFTTQMIDDVVAYGLKRGEYCGIWVDGGFVYVDISIRIASKSKAMEMGKQLNQLSVLRWKDMVCLACE
jgi:hypothetical protein